MTEYQAFAWPLRNFINLQNVEEGATVLPKQPIWKHHAMAIAAGSTALCGLFALGYGMGAGDESTEIIVTKAARVVVWVRS